MTEERGVFLSGVKLHAGNCFLGGKNCVLIREVFLESCIYCGAL